jgi:hypothetical protein
VGYGLNGPFPSKLDQLKFLRSVEFAVNNLTGSIPGNTRFRYLNEFQSPENQLGGEVPISFYKEARLLQVCYFPNNQFNEIHIDEIPTDAKQILFEGSNVSQSLLDNHINRLPSLSLIDLSNTKLSGKIPLSIWNLPYITFIDFANNVLTGPLPQQPIPAAIARLQLEGNQLTGPIPEAFVGSRDNRIDSLRLSRNKLVGTIPKNISNLNSLCDLNLDNNAGMYGYIPTTMGTMGFLGDISFEGTNLSGSIPIELCNLRSMDLLVLSADCLIDKLTGLAQLSCTDGCCTRCCDADGENCVDY